MKSTKVHSRQSVMSWIKITAVSTRLAFGPPSRAIADTAIKPVVKALEAAAKAPIALTTLGIHQFATKGDRGSYNDWGGRGCHKFVPDFRGDGTKIAPPGDSI